MGALNDVSVITDSGNDNSTAVDSITSTDISLMSSILDKALVVSPPTKATRDTYMSAFNGMQKLNKRRLRAANENDNSVRNLLDNIDLFAEKVELDGSGTVKLESSSLVVSATEYSQLSTSNKFTYQGPGE